MTEIVIVDAVRTPVGRRKGGFAGMHPADLLGEVQAELIERTGVDPSVVGQVVTGCVSQVGEQSFNVGRTAWLAQGLPQSVPATTVDTQCGSSQQATTLAHGLVAGGIVDTAIACGVEVMSRIPIGINSSKKLGLGVPIPKTYFGQYEMTSQFEGAERIADKWGISRADADEFGFHSQQRAAQAWAEDRFATQIHAVEAPDLDDEGNRLDTTHVVQRDEGLRDTTAEGLAGLKPVAREDGV
ncbi:MAG: steroid 3-ketoacyl-CoA thiolase, partial [Actinomycetota bacterium]